MSQIGSVNYHSSPIRTHNGENLVQSILPLALFTAQTSEVSSTGSSLSDLLNQDEALVNTVSNLNKIKIAIQNGAEDVNILTVHNETPLHWAARNRHIDILNLLLDHPLIDTCIENNLKYTVLTAAIFGENIEIIKILFAHPKIDINHEDTRGYIPFYYAAFRPGSLKIIQLLLNHPEFKINKESKKGFPLFFAAFSSGKLLNTELIQLLFQYGNETGLDVNKENKLGQTVLQYAAWHDYPEVVQLLVEHPNIDLYKTNKGGNTALYLAHSKNKVENIKLIINHPKFNINKKPKNGCSTLQWALNNRTFVEQLPYIVTNKIKPVHISEETYLKLKVGRNYQEIIRMLVLYIQTDVNLIIQMGNKHESLLQWAVNNNYTNIVELIIRHPMFNPEIKNINHKTPLDWAIASAHAKLALFLFKHDPNTNSEIIVKNAKLLFQWAVSYNDMDVIFLLLNDNKINPNVLVSNNIPILNWAYCEGHDNIVEKLIHHPKFDVNKIIDSSGLTPLQWAVKHNYTPLVHLLLKHKDIQLNLAAAPGFNPFNIAIFNENIKIIKLFLHHPQTQVSQGACKNNQSVLTWAMNNNHADIIHLLIQHPKFDLIKIGQNPQIPLAVSVYSAPTVEQNRKQRLENAQRILQWAADKGASEIIESLIILPEVEINELKVETKPLLEWAIKNNQLNIIQKLLWRRDFEVNDRKIDEKPVLEWLINNRDTAIDFIEIIGLFLSRLELDADIMIDNKHILEWAYEWTYGRGNLNSNNDNIINQDGALKILQSLIHRKDLDLNKISFNRLNVLSWSLMQYVPNIEFIKLLLERKELNVNGYFNGDLILNWAISRGNTEIAKLFLTERLDLNENMQDSEGKTALHWAIEKDSGSNNNTADLKIREITQLILKREFVNIHKKDLQGNSPYSLAKLKTSKKILQLEKTPGFAKLTKAEKSKQIEEASILENLFYIKVSQEQSFLAKQANAHEDKRGQGVPFFSLVRLFTREPKVGIGEGVGPNIAGGNRNLTFSEMADTSLQHLEKSSWKKDANGRNAINENSNIEEVSQYELIRQLNNKNS